MKVGFFIAGVQKGGTTALFRYLCSHPQIALPRSKELHFFDNETLDWSRPNYDDLHQNFEECRDNKILGDATPIYLFWPNALKRIRIYNPDAKIIIMLRHPVFRAYSQWRMQRARGLEELSFEDATDTIGQLRLLNSISDSPFRQFTYLQRSFYANQVAALIDTFPIEQVLFLRTDTFWCFPRAIFRTIENFLGIENYLTSATNYITPFPSSLDREIDPVTRIRLDRLFKADISASSSLTGIDLSEWLSPNYSEPMQPAS